MSVVKTIALAIASVVAVNLSGVGLNAVLGRDVTLIVDGETTNLNIVYGSVAEVLAAQNVQISSRDRVRPALSSVVTPDTTITVEYGRPIDLTLDGQNGVYWTYATTVGGVINSLGLGETALKLSTPSETPVGRDGVSLSIKTGHSVNVTANGQTQDITSFGTVADALSDLSLAWDSDDLVTPAPSTELSDGLDISLVRVDTQTFTREAPIPFETQNSDDPNATKGKVTVVTPGAEGVMSQTIVQTLHDGVMVDETVASEDVVLDPVTEVTTTGTKVTAAAAPAVKVNPGSAQAIAYDMVIARGWDDGQFNCLVSLWNRESGWRVNAANPSGAYGIPQALPGSKMSSAGADWQTNPATQITWGLGYIAGRYSTPCGAWSAFQSKGWY